jgi:hypothetical protein
MTGTSQADVGGIIDSGSNATQEWVDWGQSRTENVESGPCGEYAELNAYLTTSLRPLWQDMAPLPELLSTGIKVSVDRVVDSQGRNTNGTSGGQPLAMYLLESGVVPGEQLAVLLILLGNPFGGAVVADEVDGWLPQQGPPSGENSGEKLAPGVYYKNGQLQGSQLRRAYWAWRRKMLVNVVPAANPDARIHLAKLVGQGRPDDASDWWRIWKKGDPISPTGAWASLRDWYTRVLEMTDDARRRCIASRQAQQDVIQAGIDLEAEQQDMIRQGGLGLLALLGLYLLTRKR